MLGAFGNEVLIIMDKMGTTVYGIILGDNGIVSLGTNNVWMEKWNMKLI